MLFLSRFLSRCFQELSLCSAFRIHYMSWHGFLCHYPGDICSWNHRFVSFSKFGEFSAIISSNTYSDSLSDSSPSGILILQMLQFWLLSHSSLRLCPLFFPHLFSLCCLNWINFIALASSSLILPSVFSILSRSLFRKF